MVWWVGKGSDDFAPEYPAPRKMSLDCKTTACAYGWGSAIFRNLHFTEYGDPNIAPEEFFGINLDQVFHLFGSSQRRSPKKQAQVMEKFVKNYKPENLENAHS